MIKYLLVLLLSTSVSAESLFFIESGPRVYNSARVPASTIIYKFNQKNSNLDSVWTLNPAKITSNVYTYSSSNTVIIPEEDWIIEKINILKTNSIDKPQTINIENYGQVTKYNFLSNNNNLLDLTYKRDRLASKEHVVFDVDILKEVDSTKSLSNKTSELRLSGPLPAYGTGTADVVDVRISVDGTLESVGSNYSFETSPVPDSIIYMEDSDGWVVIANEQLFRVLLSVPVKHGPTQRELLIYNRQTKIWNSILMEGSKTAPRLINDWLVGIVAETDPETNYTTRKGFPSILTDKSMLVNPLTLQSFSLTLGEKSEVLWIENNDLYYRVEDKLFKAKIENETLINNELLYTDPKIKRIHWAFKGNMK